MTRFRIANSLLFGACVSLLSAAAIAQGASAADRTLAEALFREARDLMSAERYAEACPKLAESQRLDPGGGTLLNLAVCNEKLGLTATAWAQYREAVAQARADGRNDRLQLAEARSSALEPTLARVRIEVPADARVQGLSVTLDGTPVRPAAWGTALPVDPGRRTLMAVAPGRQRWSTTLEIAAQTKVDVRIPSLPPGGDEPPRAKAPATATSATPSGGITADASDGQRQRLTGYAIGGIGAVALGIGGYFGVKALNERADSDAQCPGERCTEEGVRLNDAAKRDANFANVGVGLGLLGLGVGSYLVLSAGSGSGSGSPHGEISAIPLHEGAAIRVKATF